MRGVERIAIILVFCGAPGGCSVNASAPEAAAVASAPELTDPLVRTGPKGDVYLSPPTVTGGDVPHADRTVAAMRWGFRACYQRGLLNNPKQSAKVHVEMTLTEEGAVDKTKVDRGADGLDLSVTSCIVRRAQASGFSKPDKAGAVVAFDVTLQPFEEH